MKPELRHAVFAKVGGFGLVAAIYLALIPNQAQAADTPDSRHTAIECGNGISMQRPLYPRNIDPATVTDAQLQAADLPPRPTDPANVPTWTRFVERATTGDIDQGDSCTVAQGPYHSPPAGLTAPKGSENAVGTDVAPNLVPADGSDSSYNWAGNVDHNAPYTDAEATWRVPYALGEGAWTAWVGVGLGGSAGDPDFAHPLVQAGMVANANSEAQPFFEVWPQQQMQLPSWPSIIETDLLYVHVTFAGSSMAFHIVDLTTGVDRRYAESIPGTSIDGHAEFIAERPTTSDGRLPALADFGSVTFTQANANYDGRWIGVGNLPHYWLWMQAVNSGRTMAKPGPIDSTGTSFSVDWLAAG